MKPNAGDKTEPASVDVDDLDEGDHLSVEVGEWNGTGWSYNAHSELGEASGFLVVETSDDTVTVISRDDRLAYNQSERVKDANDVDVDTYELTRDGFLEGARKRLRLQEYEVVEGRSGKHLVGEA
jgi:hypothetical protein